MIKGTLPETIYHYTSSDGLHGILSSGTLHFTDSLFLNDSRERKEFYSLLEEEVRTWNSPFREFLMERYFNGRGFAAGDLEAEDPSQEETSRYFVLSCSLEKDSLPMWNYYIGKIHAGGYNIHFRTSELLELLCRDPVVQKAAGGRRLLCGPVIYRDREKRKKIRELLDQIPVLLGAGKKGCVKTLDRALEKMSLFYKDGAFSHEREVRIVIPSANGTIYRLGAEAGEGIYRFRKVRAAQVPYLALDVLEKSRAISGVTAGPALDKELAVKGVEYMLCYYGFPQTCRVSAVPLRY